MQILHQSRRYCNKQINLQKCCRLYLNSWRMLQGIRMQPNRNCLGKYTVCFVINIALSEDKKLLESIINRYKLQQKVLQDESNQYRVSFQRSNKLNLELNKQIKALQKELSATTRRLHIQQQLRQASSGSDMHSSGMSTGAPTPSGDSEANNDSSCGSGESRVTFSDEDHEIIHIHEKFVLVIYLLVILTRRN